MGFVQSAGVNSGSSAVTSLSKAYASNLGSNADLFAFAYDFYRTGSAISASVSDSKGNTWTQVTGSPVFISGQITGRMFYAGGSASGANTVTITWSGANAQYPGLAIFEAPVGGTLAVDGQNSATGNSSSASVSYTPEHDGYAVGMILSAAGSVTTNPSGWTVRESTSWSQAGFLSKVCDASAVAGTPLTLAATVTSGNWIAMIAVFYASGGASPAIVRPAMIVQPNFTRRVEI